MMKIWSLYFLLLHYETSSYNFDVSLLSPLPVLSTNVTQFLAQGHYKIYFLSRINAQNMIDNIFGPPTEPFDPSFFTTEITQCHIQCADDYYDCAAFRCAMVEPQSSISTEHIERSDENSKTVKIKPSFWSKFLYYFTFGLIGSIKSSERILEIKPSFLDNDIQPVNIDIQYSCEKNCTISFKFCYFKCVCDVRSSETRCRKPVVVPPTLVPPMKSKYSGNDAYVFDWAQVNNI